jgi:hypothetical protein
MYTLTVSLSTLRAARTHSANGDVRAAKRAALRRWRGQL